MESGELDGVPYVAIGNEELPPMKPGENPFGDDRMTLLFQKIMGSDRVKVVNGTIVIEEEGKE